MSAEFQLDKAALARMIEHTLLRPEATPADVRDICREAAHLGVHGVCVSPSLISVAAEYGGIQKVTVCGFPSGAHVATVKAKEAANSRADGADEIDMVANLAFIAGGDFAGVEREIAAVRNAIGRDTTLKVIIESALWSAAELRETCRAVINGGADFVKTSTGFHPAGGASIEAVRELKAVAQDQIGIKASGGIKTLAQCVDLVAEGATRLGLSRSRGILDEMH